MKNNRDEVHLKLHIDELKTRQRELSVLNEFAISLMTIPAVEELLWHVAREVVARLDFADCVIYRHYVDEGNLVQVAASGLKNPGDTVIDNPLTIPVDKGITGSVARAKQPIIVDDVSQDPRYIPDVIDARSEICVPILVDGEVYGVIDCEDPIPERFDSNHLEILTTVASLTSSKIAQCEMMEEYIRQAEIIRQVSEIVVIADRHGKIIECNPAAEKALLGTRNDIVGQDFFELSARGYNENAFRSIIKDYLAEGKSWSRRVPVIDINDEKRYFDVSVTPASSADGDNDSFITVAREVTDQVHAEAALKERNQVLQDMSFELRDALEQSRIAQRTQAAFLANVSHELRTPLNAIVGFSDIMTNSDVFLKSPEKAQEYNQYIHSAGQHLTSLVNDILNISSLAANESEASQDHIDLNSALEICRTLTNHKAQKKEIKVEFQPHAGAPAIIFDERHFKQIITNLLDNAIKFSPDKSTVILNVELNGDQGIDICVSDQGRGIEEAQIDHIFTAFSRADWVRSQDVEGAGLGLALVSEMVAINDCEIGVASEVGKGSLFTLSIPSDRVLKESRSAP